MFVRQCGEGREGGEFHGLKRVIGLVGEFGLVFWFVDGAVDKRGFRDRYCVGCGGGHGGRLEGLWR